MDHDLRVCAELYSISDPFNGGTNVEIRWIIPPCDGQGIRSGELRLIVPVADYDLHGMVGDKIMLRKRRA